MDYEKMLAAQLRPHVCPVMGCNNTIDGVLSFCSAHWQVLLNDERDEYLLSLARLSKHPTPEVRWSFYQHLKVFIATIETREA